MFKLVDGHPKNQSLTFYVKGGTTEPQVVVCRIFIIAYPTGNFFRSVDQMVPTAKCRMVSATEASQMSHVGLGHLEVFSMTEVRRVGGGVERRGDEQQARRITELWVAQSSWTGG